LHRKFGFTLIAWVPLLIPLAAFAQNATLKGTLVDGRTKAAIADVRLTLKGVPDTSEVHSAVSGADGAFSFTGLSLRAYRIDAERLGYAHFQLALSVTRTQQNAGALALTPTVLQLGEVAVEGAAPPAIQKADTTEFSAKSFKTHPDATAEDLLAKLPGIQIKNGAVTSNGEAVQQVLVDGRPFFGGDPTVAIRNLPADVIDKIQVFDKLSDQAEFTGFDDGQSQKTINLTLRPDRRNSQFGKAYAGVGDDGQYLTGGNDNLMKGATRLSLIALANNVNQQNFSAQDLLGVLNTGSQRGGPFGGGGNGFRAGGGGRGRGGDGGGGSGFGPGGGQNGIGAQAFLVGQQDGITATNSLGANHSATFWKKLVVNQSFFFNSTDNQNDQVLTRTNSVPEDSILYYNQLARTENKNYNNRYDARLEMAVDSSNSFVDLPRLYFQNNHASSLSSGANTGADGEDISQATNDNASATTGHNLTNHLIYRHRFLRRGRTISADFGAGHTLKDGDSEQQSLSQFGAGSAASFDTLDQQTAIRTTTSSLSARVAYTEPAFSNGLVQLTYSPSMNWNDADNRARQFDPLTQTYSVPDTSLSNVFQSRSGAQNAGIGYLMRRRQLNLSANLAYQATTLHNEETLPQPGSLSATYHELLPSFMLNNNLEGHRNLRLSFNTASRIPTIGQLQNVVDNSNPLVLTTGNPALEPSVDQTLLCRYSATDVTRARGLFLLFSVQHTQDYIGSSTFTASRDSVLPSGVLLRAGSQLVTPVNLPDAWTANSFVTYSHPLKPLKSVMNLNAGVTYSQTPGLANEIESIAHTTAPSGGVVFSSNISENVDFTVSYSGAYNIVRNGTDATQNSNYYSHNAGLKLNLIGWHGIVFRNELTNNLISGLTPAYDQNVWLWNLGLGQKLMKDRRLELRLTGTDLLDQNRSTSRTVTDTYVQDTRNQTLGRYVMMNVTYTLR
jgi:Outer membrane protein beta-barrel family/Carboxypeptidase regulatory-like domain